MTCPEMKALRDWQPPVEPTVTLPTVTEILTGHECPAWLRADALAMEAVGGPWRPLAALGLIGRLWTPATPWDGRGAIPLGPTAAVWKVAKSLPPDVAREVEEYGLAAVTLLANETAMDMAVKGYDELQSLAAMLSIAGCSRLTLALLDLGSHLAAQVQQPVYMPDQGERYRIAFVSEPDSWWAEMSLRDL
jgi:hypothetical protein